MLRKYEINGLVGIIALYGCVLAGCSDDADAGAAGSGGSSAAGGAGSGTGGQAGGDGGSAGDGVAGSGGSSPSDTTLFSPDIPRQYVGTVIEPGMEIIALTIREDEYSDAVWLAAVENTSTDALCAVNMDVTFLDSGGAEIASGSGILEVPLHRGSDGTGSLVRCLGPGQIGMTVGAYTLQAEDVPNVASMNYDFGALILVDAVPTNDITVTGVQIVDQGSGRYQFTGALNNDSTTPVTNPSVSIFGVNSVGRPLAEAGDIELTTVSAGSAWQFSTTSFSVPVEDYVAFPDATD
jgi:hypothetical protein